MQDKPTLCWKCEKACGGCAWSKDFIPVDGWKAEKTMILADRGYYANKVVDSYIVKKCPLFVDDTHRYNKKPETVKFVPVMVKKPHRAKCPRGSLRDRIWKLRDRDRRIDKLVGEERTAAVMIFRFNNSLDDVCENLYISTDRARKVLNSAMEKMEAMA